jgi:hypothetical protein
MVQLPDLEELTSTVQAAVLRADSAGFLNLFSQRLAGAMQPHGGISRGYLNGLSDLCDRLTAQIDASDYITTAGRRSMSGWPDALPLCYKGGLSQSLSLSAAKSSSWNLVFGDGIGQAASNVRIQ